MKKKVLSIVLCVAMVASLLSGCSSKSNKDTTSGDKTKTKTETETPKKASGDKKYADEITVDVFDNLANYQGIQSGWFAKIVKDKFNMKLNIIAPNVAGGGDTLYQTRSAAGNLGDLIIAGTDNGKFQDMVTAGLLEDMTPLLKDSDLMKNYENAVTVLNKKVKQDGIYGIPSEISGQEATTPCEGLQLTYGPYVRWDYYKEAGYPEAKTLEDLLPILKKMQDAARKTTEGKKAYAISLFKDWDGNMMNNAKQPCCFYGYDELGFALLKADGSDKQSIIDSDSMYVRTLKFFFDANQQGLVDPESTTQKYDTLNTKFTKGQVLFSFWPWLGQSQYNTDEHKKASKGFELMNIDDMKIISDGCKPEGNQKIMIGIGSQAKDKERLADFIQWLYSPEGVLANEAEQNNGAAGPEGMTWEKKDGKPVLTDFGKQVYIDGKYDVPENYGGGSWKDGASALNFRAVNRTDKNPDGIPYLYTLWESVIAMDKTPLTAEWKEKMGADTDMDYFTKNDKFIVAPGNSYIQPEETSEITTLRGECKQSIIDYSWKMIFAKNEGEFKSLLAEMQEKVKGFGYDKVFEVDKKNCDDLSAARQEAAKAK